MESSREPKRRRFAKACDACYKRKVKCHWRPPACPDCVRKGCACTFTRAEPDLNKPRRTAKQLELVQDRLNRVEALLRESEEQQGTTNHATSSATSGTISAHASPDDVELITDDGPTMNHQVATHMGETSRYSPIYLLRTLRRLLNDTESTSSNVAWKTCRLLFRCAWYQHNEGSTSPEAHRLLNLAVESIGKVLLLDSRDLIRLQVLLHMVVCIQTSGRRNHEHQIPVLLASAVRVAHCLDLHVSDSTPDLDNEDRAERQAAFWTLYIFEREYSLRSRLPPIINDDDIHVSEPFGTLWTRARMIEPLSSFPSPPRSRNGSNAGDDENGTHVSPHPARPDTERPILTPTEKPLNLFAARHTLARIQGQTYKRLHTHRARTKSAEYRAETQTALNADLQEWKETFFEVGNPSELSQRWPEATLPHIARLHFTYFLCLLRANPSLPFSADIHNLALNATDVSGIVLDNLMKGDLVPDACVQAARGTLLMARVVRKGDLGYLTEVLQYVLPAMVTLLSYLMQSHARACLPDAETVELTNAWLDLLDSIVEKSGDGELRVACASCRMMRDMARGSYVVY